MTIVSFLALMGVGVGTIAGVMTTVQNGYLAHGMTEIFFWGFAKDVNHHLAIFLKVAAWNVFLLVLLGLFRLHPVKIINFILLPFTVFALIFTYGQPYWPVFQAHPGRLIGKTSVMVFLSISVLMVLFLISWLFGVRHRLKGVWNGSFSRFFARPVTFLVICLLPVFVNLLDYIDWFDSDGDSRNLILISIDTLRADHLGCYGYGKEISPNIDAFAASGIQFSRAISQSSWTLPVHASLFNGFYPSVHGAVTKHRSVPLSFMMLSEILKNAGYATVAITGGGFLNPIYGFKQGFEEYRHFNGLDTVDVWDVIDGFRDNPFFLFLHTYTVHNYFVPPELIDRLEGKYREDFGELSRIMAFVDRHLTEDLDTESMRIMEHLRDRYDLSILHIDRQFGSLLDGLADRELLDNTVIVFLSDHGEEFGEHGRTYHGGTLYNEQVHVPLLMKVPGMAVRNRVVTEIIELLDVFPTLLELLELPVPGGIDGESLVPLVEGKRESIDGLAFSEISSHVTEKYSVCDTSMKLIYSPEIENLPLSGAGSLESFELSWGPGWKENVSTAEADELVDPFQEWYARMNRSREMSASAEEITIDPALREELEALGYID
jgi:arylsulfatase A-like enzyme